MSKIIKIRAREILDSRGNPTVEADVFTSRRVVKGFCSFWCKHRQVRSF